MNIKKHLLRTSTTLSLLVTSGFAMSMEDDCKPTRIDNYIFKGDTVYFENPCYKKNSKLEEKLGLETKKIVEITNGSALNFSAKGTAGNVIRVFSTLSEAYNPFGLSHSGFVVNLDPRAIYNTVIDIMPGGIEHTKLSLTEKAGKAILREIERVHKPIISATHFPDVKASFAIESFGTPSEVLHGIAPHVHIGDLSSKILEYSGNIFIRPLFSSVPSDVTMSFLKEFVGRPYESLRHLDEFIGSVASLNKEEKVDNVFCSELVALFYKKCGIFDKSIISNNVIPGMLGSRAGRKDLLRGKAMDDIPLKIQFLMNLDKDGRHEENHTLRNWIDSLFAKAVVGCLSLCE